MKNTRRVGRALKEMPDNIRVRMGTIAAVNAGPPRTMNVNLAGTVLLNVPTMDHVVGNVGRGVFLLNITGGGMIIIGEAETG
jgi:hypothetical protein